MDVSLLGCICHKNGDSATNQILRESGASAVIDHIENRPAGKGILSKRCTRCRNNLDSKWNEGVGVEN